MISTKLEIPGESTGLKNRSFQSAQCSTLAKIYYTATESSKLPTLSGSLSYILLLHYDFYNIREMVLKKVNMEVKVMDEYKLFFF